MAGTTGNNLIRGTNLRIGDEYPLRGRTDRWSGRLGSRRDVPDCRVQSSHLRRLGKVASLKGRSEIG